MLRPFFAAVLEVLFPPLCHVCRSFIPTAGEIHICSECRDLMPSVVSPLCIVCGISFNGAGNDHLCGRCSSSHPHFNAARAALVYEGTSRDLIHAFKYRNKIHLRRPLALLALERLSGFMQSRRPDLVMPVPLHRKKLSSRGFNQAILLGEIFSQRLKIPLDRRNLRRVRWTEPQVNLAAHERRANVRGAFSIHQPELVTGRRVLLVDDVLTTGSTVDECGRVLQAAGAADVTVITVARAFV
ncbi:MAG: ComF family protein [Geobacteraceae bacterium]|nr:ComF family protein [Geobacteraceae bacterium]